MSDDTQHEKQNYMESIEKFLDYIGVHIVSDQEKLELAAELHDHFNRLIADTVILNMTSDQAKGFLDFMETEPESEAVYERAMLEAASIPGLSFKIEDVILKEIEVLKASMEILNSRED